MDLFDLKANILPNVDPNCDSLSDSINKLKMMKEMNINKVCASPEYYDSINFNIENIIIDIQKESSKLNEFIIPQLLSSVVYPLNINFKEIPKLVTISSTNYIFCRFPTYDLNKNFIENINYLLTQNYIPILVNLENSYLNNKLNKIKELKELGCIICVDLFLYDWSKEFTYCINKMEASDLIDFVSGFSKFENLNQIINKFSSETGISKEKIENIYMDENPNLILEI